MASLKKRGGTYYLQYYLPGRKQKRINLETDNYQIAKEKKRRFESAQATGEPSPLPTQTPLTEALTGYVEHIRTVKTGKSAQTDIYYLREVFGPMCDALKVTSQEFRKRTKKGLPQADRGRNCVGRIDESGRSFFSD